MIRREEWACKCGACSLDVRPHPDLFLVVTELAQFATDLILTSGIRCPEHNARQGGVPTSQHLTGEAVDLALPGEGRGYELRRLVQRICPTGNLLLEQGPRHLHLGWQPGRGRESFHPDALRKVGIYHALAI